MKIVKMTVLAKSSWKAKKKSKSSFYDTAHLLLYISNLSLSLSH